MESIYFDAEKNFTRATWQNHSYILDRGKWTSDSIISSNGNYQIEVVDSTHIKLVKQDYVVEFYGNPWKSDKYFHQSLKRFILGDSIKNRLLGKWEFVGYEKDPEIDQKDLRHSNRDVLNLKSIGHRAMHNNTTLDFSTPNILQTNDINGELINYEFIVDDEILELTINYNVIRYNYRLTKGYQLELIKKHENGNELKSHFRKKGY